MKGRVTELLSSGLQPQLVPARTRSAALRAIVPRAAVADRAGWDPSSQRRSAGASISVRTDARTQEEHVVLQRRTFRGFQEGDVVCGTVQSVMQHLAVVDLGGGITGSLNSSSFSQQHVERLDTFLSEGDTVRAFVVRLDRACGLVKLSTRVLERTPGDMLRDPQLVYDMADDTARAFRQRAEQDALDKWEWWSREPEVDQLVEGVVRSVGPSGAAVSLLGGFCGWLRKDLVSKQAAEWPEKALKVDTKVKALIRSLDPERGRVELSTKELEPAPGDMLRAPELVYDMAKAMHVRHCNGKRELQADEAARRSSRWQFFYGPMRTKEGSVVAGVVEEVTNEAATVRLAEGVTGVLRLGRISHARVPRASLLFKSGMPIKAVVLEMVPKQGRVELSTKELEPTPGDMMVNRRLVYDNAEEQRRMHAAQQEAERENAHKKRTAGSVLTGLVLSVKPAGAEIDLGGGIVGWLAKEEFTGGSVVRASQLKESLSVGEKVKALVLRDPDQGRVGLSTKRLEPTPGAMLVNRHLVYDNAEATVDQFYARWRAARQEGAPTSSEQLQKNFTEGEVVAGTIQGFASRSRRGAAVVVLKGGVKGELTTGQFSAETVRRLSKVLKVGEKIKAMVVGVDSERGRVKLSTKRLEPTPGAMLRNRPEVYGKAEELAAEEEKEEEEDEEKEVAAAAEEEGVPL